MDYVVAGFGIGAILALIGFALWELYGNVEEPGKSWLSRAAIGLMLGALVIWAVTGVSLISNIDDSTGARLVLLTSLVTLIAIVGGVFFYWRADRALAATMPRPVKVSAQREVAPAAAAPLVLGDVELSDWDSWPERDAGKQAEAIAVVEGPAPPPSFEPEVAADAVPESETDINSPGRDAGAEDGDAKIAEVRAEPEGADETAKPEEPVAEGAEPAPELPSNVRPFRLPAIVEPSEPDAPDDVLIAESVELAEVEEAVEEPEPEPEPEPAAAPEPVVDGEEGDLSDGPEKKDRESDENRADDRPGNSPGAAKGNGEPATYESALLADVDGSLADQEGGYRSPLLSDLGSDKLEGVGLAKWRPDARLTEQEDEDAPPPAKRSRRG